MPGLFVEMGLTNFLPRLASNHGDPPDLCLLDSWDYMHETPHPASPTVFFLNTLVFRPHPEPVKSEWSY
jgi:hypothetical protein